MAGAGRATPGKPRLPDIRIGHSTRPFLAAQREDGFRGRRCRREKRKILPGRILLIQEDAEDAEDAEDGRRGRGVEGSPVNGGEFMRGARIVPRTRTHTHTHTRR
jgi:hypothetical protein